MHLNFLKERELNELYISSAMRWFAISMFSVFVPIYLLVLHYSFSEIMIFFAVQNLSHGLFVFPGSAIGSRLGYKHAIAITVPLLLLYYILLHSLPVYGWPIYIIAMIFGISEAIFWTSYHIDFSKFSSRENRESEVCFARIIWTVFNCFGPLLGGILLFYTDDFKLLLTFVSIILISSTIPLFLSKDIHDPIKMAWKQVFRGHKKKNIFAFVGYGLESGVGQVIWPMFIFQYIVYDYSSLGTVTSLSILTSAILIIVIGRYSSRHRRRVLRMGSISNALVWIFKSMVSNLRQLFFIDAIYGVTRTLVTVPFSAMSYDKANDEDAVRFTVFKETVLNGSRGLLFVLLTFIPDYNVSFFIASVASLFYFLF